MRERHLSFYPAKPVKIVTDSASFAQPGPVSGTVRIPTPSISTADRRTAPPLSCHRGTPLFLSGISAHAQVRGDESDGEDAPVWLSVCWVRNHTSAVNKDRDAHTDYRILMSLPIASAR